MAIISLRPENQIVDSWEKSGRKPMVSVIMIAFNHEAFINQAMESILMQKVDLLRNS